MQCIAKCLHANVCYLVALQKYENKGKLSLVGDQNWNKNVITLNNYDNRYYYVMIRKKTGLLFNYLVRLMSYISTVFLECICSYNAYRVCDLRHHNPYVGLWLKSTPVKVMMGCSWHAWTLCFAPHSFTSEQLSSPLCQS